MNVYTEHFRVLCPKTGKWIAYKIVIETRETIMAEAIQEAVSKFDGLLQEDIADHLSQQFGGHQRITGVHGSTHIETIRP